MSHLSLNLMILIISSAHQQKTEISKNRKFLINFMGKYDTFHPTQGNSNNFNKRKHII